MPSVKICKGEKLKGENHETFADCSGGRSVGGFSLWY